MIKPREHLVRIYKLDPHPYQAQICDGVSDEYRHRDVNWEYYRVREVLPLSADVEEAAEESRKRKGYKDNENFIDPYLPTAIVERKKSDAYRDGYKDGHSHAMAKRDEEIEKLKNRDREFEMREHLFREQITRLNAEVEKWKEISESCHTDMEYEAMQIENNNFREALWKIGGEIECPMYVILQGAVEQARYRRKFDRETAQSALTSINKVLGETK